MAYVCKSQQVIVYLTSNTAKRQCNNTKNTPKQNIFGVIYGEMVEWSKALAWKASVPERVPRVQIPLSPPKKIKWLY